MKVCLNGKLVDSNSAKISIFDHGLLYGDGVFEGIRAYNCLIFKLKDHIERLFASAKAIHLEMPISKRKLSDYIIATLKANKLKDAYIRLVVTRGVGDLGLDYRKCKEASFFIITDKVTLYSDQMYKKGLDIVTVSTRRNIPEALNPQIKSLNYLNNILAKIEAVNAGAEEAVMLNQNGFVSECSGDNICIVKGSNLFTPPVFIGVLEGITRDCVMGISIKSALASEEKVLTRYDIYNADEMFLTGTAAEIIPVVKVDGRVINDGKPGVHTLELMKEFKKLTKTDGVRYAL
ncbi:MAG: branched-chain-amino-acid transaminase [Candidatus Gygaella obscura]|nr:branched-chain-amino-acid transaminase [Candidatus Gygaella obscura]